MNNSYEISLFSYKLKNKKTKNECFFFPDYAPASGLAKLKNIITKKSGP